MQIELDLLELIGVNRTEGPSRSVSNVKRSVGVCVCIFVYPRVPLGPGSTGQMLRNHNGKVKNTLIGLQGSDFGLDSDLDAVKLPQDSSGD